MVLQILYITVLNGTYSKNKRLNMSNIGKGATGTILQGAGTGASPNFSTATYPATATGTGTLLRADGTNWSATTSTYPNTNAVSTLLYASSANVMSALATANSAILATNSSGVPSITAASGNWLNTARSAFAASLSGNVTNATGDNTTYTIAFDTEAFDQGNDFATNTFTAPVTGKYMFNYQISLSNLGAAHTSAIVTIAGINTARFQPFVIVSSGGIVTFGGSIFVSLTAAATVTMAVTVSGSTKTVTVVGGTSGTTMSGYLVC